MAAPINWVPAKVDPEKPNAARVYDYCLDAAHNFTVDLEFGDRFADVAPAHEFEQDYASPSTLIQVHPLMERQ